MTNTSRQYSERERQHSRNYQHKLRDRVIMHLGGQCVKCGFIDTRALQIDHVEGNGVQHIRAVPWRQRYIHILELMPGTVYQLLCANCNWIKRSERNENPKPRSSM